ncbi:MAG: TMEM175 family protein [Bacteroidota bacterium]
MQKEHRPVELQEHATKHPKQDFQVERIAFFSDAVFAIAITLLVIEFKIPKVTKDNSYAEVWQEVVALKYKFFSLILSFALIANYWMRHHLLFKHIHNYNRKVVMANLLCLLPIIFFPFTTAFFYDSLNNENILVIPYRLFVLNNVLAGGTAYFFYWIVIRRFGDLSYPMEKKDRYEFEFRLPVMAISFLLVLILSFIVPFEYSLIGIAPMAFLNIFNKFFKKAAR